MSIENPWRNVDLVTTPGGALSIELSTLGSIRNTQSYQFRYTVVDGEVSAAQARIVDEDEAHDFGTPSATYPGVATYGVSLEPLRWPAYDGPTFTMPDIWSAPADD